MGRRLALLADTSHDGPWTKASGAESVARVRGLGEGDKVWLMVELEPEGEMILNLVEGLTPLLTFTPGSWKRYKACKQGNGYAAMTSVEVFLASD
jgi:hypothetical protein